MTFLIQQTLVYTIPLMIVALAGVLQSEAVLSTLPLTVL
jgi:hypothetical protein